ncbi:MAG: hypothetical protein WCB71_06195, partial [Aestuariivirga sp.]
MDGTATGIKDIPELDGSHMLQVTSEKGEVIDIRFSPEQVREFVSVLQRGILTQWDAKNGTPVFPLLTVVTCAVGHGPSGPEFLVSTEQAGNITLAASDSVLNNMKSK